MLDSALYFWLVFGVVLVVAEVLLPGLVSVFVGLGALTVAGLLHFNYIDSVVSQLLTWFVSSTVYIFSLRLLVMRYYPTDTEKQNIDEDQAMIGQVAEVVEDILKEENGRIRLGEGTWKADSEDGQVIKAGGKVEVIGRKNITWIVKEVRNEEI
jgi:membrane protein implicated in regulation of membrane protease activity